MCNEVIVTIAEIWDGVQIKISFGRGFDAKLMQQWEDLVQIVSGLVLSMSRTRWSGNYMVLACIVAVSLCSD